MKIEIWKVPGIKVPAPNERIIKVLMSPEATNTPRLSILVSIISPHSTTGLHTHEVDEFMYVVTGKGESTIAGEKSEIEPDVLLHTPAKVQHEIRNLSDETLKLFCVFSPPFKPQGFLEKATELAKSARS